MTAAIGVDIGTTTISINLIEKQSGAVIQRVTLPNHSSLKRGEQDLFSDLQNPDAIFELVQSVLQELTASENVCSIGITGQMHGIVYLNASGQAVSPLYTWRDGRGNMPCHISRDGKSYAEYLSELTGYSMASGYGCTTYFYHTVTKSVPEGAACFCSVQDYIAMRLVGARRPLLHVTNAAGFGLFDFSSMTFDAAAIKKAGMTPDFLPKVISDSAVAGMYKGSIPVSVAIGDNQASFLGSVRDMENSVLANVGTGSQITFAAKRAEIMPGLELRPCTDGYLLQVGSSLCGGRALALLEEFFRKTAEMVAQKKIESAYPGMDTHLERWLRENTEGVLHTANQLEVSTKFCGTRENPAERGAIKNIGMQNFTPENMAVGFLNGIASELFEMYQRAGVNHSVLVGAGNGMRKNRVLRKMMELVFRRKLYIPAHKEEAAYGAALFSLVCAGFCKDIQEAQQCIKYEQE